MIKRIQTSLRYRLGTFTRPMRSHLEQRRYRALQKDGDDFSIISQNCIGTFMYHDLGLEFRSPTINLFMKADDFIRFAERLDYYLSLDGNKIEFIKSENECPLLVDILEECPYPVGILEDICIYFVHYPDQKAAVDAWNRRRLRVNREKLFLVMTDKDGCTEEIRKRFLKLPYKKVFFSSKKIDRPWVVYMPCFADQKEVGGMTDFCSVTGKRYYAKYFDYIEWLTENRK